MLKDRSYYSGLARIALPIIAQNFVSSMLNVIDVAMIGQLGETAIASVGLANQLFFLLMLMLFGTNSGVGVFNAQLWGKGDVKSMHKVQGIGLSLGLSTAFVFTIVAQVFPGAVLSFFSNDPAVIASGTVYLRTVSWSYLLTAVTFSFASVLRSTGMTRIPMIVSIIALSLKTLLNYGLILGHFGLPALGPQGAALSTVIARALECTALLTVIYVMKLPPAAKIREFLGFNRSFLTTVLRTSLPVLANETLWSLGILMYNKVYGNIGTEAYAAVSIALSIENLAFVIFMGMSEATGILIGHRIGGGEEHKAFDYARQTIVMATIGAILMGLLVLVGSGFILTFYKLSPQAMADARIILRVIGLVMWIRVTNMVIIVGVLRAGGDTRFSMFLDAGTVWFVGVPLAVLGGLVLHLPVYFVYMMVMTEEAVKYGIGIWRFSSKKWIRNLTHAV
jgi:putative MATE family efflux protein